MEKFNYNSHLMPLVLWFLFLGALDACATESSLTIKCERQFKKLFV